MGSINEHQNLVNALLLEFGARPNVRVWIRVVGFDSLRKIKYGIKGESDIQGIVSPSGRMLCLEVKTGKAKLSKEQMRWKAMIEKFGGIHIVARSVSQAIDDFNLANLD